MRWNAAKTYLFIGSDKTKGEKAKALATARVLLGKNIAANIIAAATGLAPEERAELLDTGTNDRP